MLEIIELVNFFRTLFIQVLQVKVLSKNTNLLFVFQYILEFHNFYLHVSSESLGATCWWKQHFLNFILATVSYA